jgi:hypothetical protein
MRALGKPPKSRAVTLKKPGWLWVISLGQDIQVHTLLMTSPSVLLRETVGHCHFPTHTTFVLCLEYSPYGWALVLLSI